MRNPVRLHDSGVYQLANVIELDGRPVSSHPAHARGFAPFNCYVVADSGDALMLETGFTAHRESVLAQLAQVVASDAPLWVLLQRWGEFGSICNAHAIADEFNLDTFMGGFTEPLAEWTDFDPEFVRWGESPPTGSLRRAKYKSLSGQPTAPIGTRSERRLEIIKSDLQLLPVYWLFDQESGTLFTADAFTHVWHEDPDGPWIVAAGADDTTVEHVCDYLATTRFWWVVGADGARLCESLSRIFDSRTVTSIAPSWGCVLHGRDVVARHVELVQNALLRLAEREPVGPALTPPQ